MPICFCSSRDGRKCVTGNKKYGVYNLKYRVNEKENYKFVQLYAARLFESLRTADSDHFGAGHSSPSAFVAGKVFA